MSRSGQVQSWLAPWKTRQDYRVRDQEREAHIGAGSMNFGLYTGVHDLTLYRVYADVVHE